MNDTTTCKEVNPTLAAAFKALWRMVTILQEEYAWPFPDLLPTHLVQPISDHYWKNARMGTYEMQKTYGLLERVAEFYIPKRASVFRLQSVQVKSWGPAEAGEIDGVMLRGFIAEQNIPGLIEAIQSVLGESGVYTPPRIDNHMVDPELDRFVYMAVESGSQFETTDQLEGLLDRLSQDTVRRLAAHGLRAILPALETQASQEAEEAAQALEEIERQRVETEGQLDKIRRISQLLK